MKCFQFLFMTSMCTLIHFILFYFYFFSIRLLRLLSAADALRSAPMIRPVQLMLDNCRCLILPFGRIKRMKALKIVQCSIYIYVYEMRVRASHSRSRRRGQPMRCGMNLNQNTQIIMQLPNRDRCNSTPSNSLQIRMELIDTFFLGDKKTVTTNFTWQFICLHIQSDRCKISVYDWLHHTYVVRIVHAIVTKHLYRARAHTYRM